MPLKMLPLLQALGLPLWGRSSDVNPEDESYWDPGWLCSILCHFTDLWPC